MSGESTPPTQPTRVSGKEAALDDRIFYYLAGVPVLGVAAQWLAWRLRLPSILLLLLFGILLGRFVNIDDLLVDAFTTDGAVPDTSAAERLLFPIVSLAVAVILFEGGLTLRFSEIKQSAGTIFRLVTLGAVVSWIGAAMLAWLLLGWDYRLAILFGAILVVTGPTVVIPLLRHIRPDRRVGSVLKWEGIVIDPIGAMFAVLVFEKIFPSVPLAEGESYWLRITLMVAMTLAIGVVLAVIIGELLVQVTRRFWLPDHLHAVLFLAAALGSFALSNYLSHESGLVTVTLLGIYLANQNRVSLTHVLEFKENVGVFLISTLFILLGSRLDWSAVTELGWHGLAFLTGMILVVRPLSVWLATVHGEMTSAERCFMSMLAPRGIVAAAVASIFALRIGSLADETGDMASLIEQSRQLVPMTFLVIIGTVTVYGISAAPFARWLALAERSPQGVLIAGAQPMHRKLASVLQSQGVPVVLVDTNYGHVTQANMAGQRAYCASILSDQFQDFADLSGIGRLLAMTANDEVNLLACKEFQHVFGKANVYQLPPNNTASGPRGGPTESRRARELFGGGLSQSVLTKRFADGHQFKATALSENFNFQDYQKRYGKNANLLFTIEGGKDTATRKVRIATGQDPLKPTDKQTVIALVLPGETPTSEG